MPYSTPLDVHVDHLIPVVDLQALEWRVRHQPGVVEHHVDAPVGLHGGVDQRLHLVSVRDIRGYGQRLAASACQFVGQRLDTVDTPRT